MAVRSSNLQEIHVGANKVAGVVDITYSPPELIPVKSETLNATHPKAISAKVADGYHELRIKVEINDEDTNGQVALSTACDNNTTVEANYYPECNVTGSKKYSGDAFVLSKPSIGGQGKGVVQEGEYLVVYKTPPTETTVT